MIGKGRVYIHLDDLDLAFVPVSTEEPDIDLPHGKTHWHFGLRDGGGLDVVTRWGSQAHYVFSGIARKISESA